MLRTLVDRRRSLGEEHTRMVALGGDPAPDLAGGDPMPDLAGGVPGTHLGQDLLGLGRGQEPLGAAWDELEEQVVQLLVGDLERTYRRKKAADKELAELVRATGTSLLDLTGIGPSEAARLLVDVGDITRFPDRGHFASWNGTAPIDASSGDHVRHRLSRAGNRQINRVLHIMATVELRYPGVGRDYFDRKKPGGKTSMEAMRCLKRRLSDVVYRAMLDDAVRTTESPRTGPGGHRGTALQSSVAGSHPHTDTSDQSLPGPATKQRRTPLPAAS